MNENTQAFKQLLAHIASAARLGADALQQAQGNTGLLADRLEHAAAAFVLSSEADALLAQIELSDEWGERLNQFLEGYECPF